VPLDEPSNEAKKPLLVKGFDVIAAEEKGMTFEYTSTPRNTHTVYLQDPTSSKDLKAESRLM
jgi:hypothetical protein